MPHPPSTLRTIALLLALVGCTTDPGTESADSAALPADALPPAPPATLNLPNRAFVLGATQTVRVSGVDPGDTVYLLNSNGSGAAYCFTNPPICTNLPGPRARINILQTTTADANGVATFTVNVPAATPASVIRFQAVADPNGPYEVSNMIRARYLSANGDADGDGLTNTAELGYGTNPEAADTDGDGASDGVEINAGTNPLDANSFPTDSDGDGSFTPADCDDNNSAVFPGATEACNGIDDNCDGVADGAGVWWDDRYPYRVLLSASGSPTRDTLSPPVAADINFRAALDALGDAAALDPSSIRVVRQDCALGMPVMPSEWMDGISGIFEKDDLTDPLGDETGALAFQIDRDGNLATREGFPIAGTATFGVYFASAANTPNIAPPTYNYSLTATTNAGVSELSNNLSIATFRRVDGNNQPVGGLIDSFGVRGGPNVGRQASTAFGNGIYFAPPGGGAGGGWVTARGDSNAQLSVVHAGPIFAAVQSSGTRTSANGGFDYTYTYYMFAGRPEIYTKVYFEINQANSNVGPQGAFWTAAVRPFNIDNLTFVNGNPPSEGSRGNPTYDWVRGTYGTSSPSPFGIGVGFRESVLQRGQPVWQADGRYLGLVGQDFEFAPSTTEHLFQTGDVVVDNSIIAIYPHNGLFGSIAVDFYGILDGIDTSLSAPQAF